MFQRSSRRSCIRRSSNPNAEGQAFSLPDGFAPYCRRGRRRFVHGASVEIKLPLLEHAEDLQPAEWLRTSMTTVYTSVASFLPGPFESYARVYHPFIANGRSALTW